MQLSIAKKKWIKSLQQKKFRDEQGFFVAEGEKVIGDILAAGGAPEIVVVEENKHFKGVTPIKQVFSCDAQTMKRISSMATPPGVLAVFKNWDFSRDVLQNEMPRWLIADGIKDPGNLGTLIRTAHWFGLNAFIALNSTVETYNPKTVQSTMGSLGKIPVFQFDADEFYSQFGNKTTFLGADLEGNSLYSYNSMPSFALVIGSESHGLSDISKKYLNERIFIPSHHPVNRPESLNAAVSAGIILSVVSV